jgi:SEC-C motif-containing protein
MKCLCHSEKNYEECCAPYHKGGNPPTAQALMRSRYSAYALGNTDYIISTTHPEHPDVVLPSSKRKKQILLFAQNTHFEGLEILEFVEMPPSATVTFKAILTQNGQDASFVEKSDFGLISGRWLYRKALSHSRL